MEREQAVLAATAELLVERGYAALTTDAVALRAGASKATIYRRWPNKAQLVRATLDAADAARNASMPDTGALRPCSGLLSTAKRRPAFPLCI